MKESQSYLHRVKERLAIFGRNLARLCRFMSSPDTSSEMSKILFAEISNPSYERYLYLLLKFFEIAGFSVRFRFNLKTLLNLRNYSELILNLKGFQIVLKEPEHAAIALSDRPRSASRAIEISTNYFRSDIRTVRDFVFPYQMHPLMYENGLYKCLESSRKQRRDIRIFYSGNTGIAYDNPDIYKMYGKLSRRRITEILELEFANGELCKIEDYSENCDFNIPDQPPLVMFKNFTVGLRDWVRWVARSEFFIAAPGVCMPFSHNIIESMAAGTIPITEYPEMFDPPLVSGTNCLAFQGDAGLIEAVRNAMSISEDEIGRMKQAVSDYYDLYLEPVSVINRLQERLPNIERIILNSEHMSLYELKKGTLDDLPTS